MTIDFSRDFQKQTAKLDKKVKLALASRLRLFVGDQFHPFLNNHKLTGEFAGARSINISGDLRAIYCFDSETDTATFTHIGTHSQLYG